MSLTSARIRELGLLALLTLALLVLGGRPTRAGEPEPAPEAGEDRPVLVEASQRSSRQALVWRPASVAWPLAPLLAEGEEDQLSARLEQRLAMLEGRMPAPSLRGPVELDADQAVAVRVAALESVRVRLLAGEADRVLRFVRVGDGRLASRESGRELEPGPGGERRWELTQPPGFAGLWSIEADGPATIVIERAEPRSPRYVSAEVEHDLLRWIDAGGELADLPGVVEPDEDTRAALHLHTELAREARDLIGEDRRLAAALASWRMIVAIQALDRVRPAVRPYFVDADLRRRSLELADTRAVALDRGGPKEPRWRLAELEAGGQRRWQVDHKGPGRLRIRARTWAKDAEQLAPARLRVIAGGRVLAELPLSGRAARYSPDPDTAFPRFEPLLSEGGAVVGEVGQLILATAPGRRPYELELVGGSALIFIDADLRVESTAPSARGWTPSRRARVARRKLARAPEGQGAAIVEQLLAAGLHEPLPAGSRELAEVVGERSPALALSLLAEQLASPLTPLSELEAGGRRAVELFERLAADPDFDGLARGQLRTRWLELAALHRARKLAAAIADAGASPSYDPVAELPLRGLRVLAELTPPPRVGLRRGAAWTLLEMAWRRAPANGELRAQMLRTWSEATRWSRRRPSLAIDPDPEGREALQWLVPRTQVPEDLSERESTWLRLVPGEPLRFSAEVGEPPQRRELDGTTTALARVRLFDLNVSTPAGESAPVRLRVDERSWLSPQLFPVQRHRLALTAGEHELELDGPAGTVAWAELPPSEDLAERDPDQLGRRERLWPIDGARWRIPGVGPGHVRVELRALEGEASEPMRITVHRDDLSEPAATLIFDPRRPISAGEGGGELEIDELAMPIAVGPRASPRHDLVLPIDSKTSYLWLEVEGGRRLAGAVSVRRAMRAEELSGPSPSSSAVTVVEPDIAVVFAELEGLDGPALLAELDSLSQLLLATPDKFGARARRAAILLMLGETGHARADLLRLAAWSEREGLPRARQLRAEALLVELDRRFEAFIEPREVTVRAPDSGELEPILVEPALTAVIADDPDSAAALEPWLESWAQARERGGAEGLELLRRRLDLLESSSRERLLGELAEASWMARIPELARDASRAWLQLYGRVGAEAASPVALDRAREPLAVGLAAVAPLLRHLDDPSSDARDAGVAFGLARELEQVYSHTSVRRLAFVAAVRSEWDRLSHSENNAGFERLELPARELEPSPATKVREALLAVPWPLRQGELLRPGRKGVINWDAKPGAIEAEFWCRVTRPDRGPERADLAEEVERIGEAKLSLSLRGPGGEPRRVEVMVHDGEAERVRLPVEGRGRYRLEAVLSDDPIWLCAWHSFVDGPGDEEAVALETRRRARWWTAGARQGVEFVVLGPTSFHVEARAVVDAEPGERELIATVESLDGGAPGRAELGLATKAETTVITEARRRFTVARSVGQTLVITEPGPHRVRLRPRRGTVLLRTRMRRDRPDLPPPARVSLRELLADGPDPVGLDEGARLLGPRADVAAIDAPAQPPNRIGTLELYMRGGLDELNDVDDLRQRPGLRVSVAYRRVVIEERLWVRVAGQVRSRDRTPVAGGGVLDLRARPGLGLRAGASVEAMSERYAGRPEGSVRAEAFLDRPTQIAPRLQLRPGVDFSYRWQSLDPDRLVDAAALAGELEPHPRVYLDYVHDHPIVLRPELELRGYPLQDLALSGQAGVVPNSDFAGLDRVDLDAGLEGIARRPHPWVPGWALGYQASLRFADADRQRFFVRHAVTAELSVGVWVRDAARIVLGVRDRVLASAVAPVRNVAELWLRVDASFGRRMRDYGPREMWFREPWAPRAWGGEDQRQAASTTTGGGRR